MSMVVVLCQPEVGPPRVYGPFDSWEKARTFIEEDTKPTWGEVYRGCTAEHQVQPVFPPDRWPPGPRKGER